MRTRVAVVLLALSGISSYATETVQADREHVAEIRIGIVLCAEHVSIPDVSMEDRCFSQLPNRIERFEHKLSCIESRLANQDRRAIPGKQMIKLMGAYKIPRCVFWQVTDSIRQTRVTQFPADYLRRRATHIGEFQGIDQVSSGQHLIGSKGNVVLVEPTPVLSLVRMRTEFGHYPSALCIDDRVGAFIGSRGRFVQLFRLCFGVFNQFVGLPACIFHLPELLSRRLPLPPHDMSLLFHLVALPPHFAGLPAIDPPREEHHNQLQNPNNSQYPCKPRQFPLRVERFSSAVCWLLACVWLLAAVALRWLSIATGGCVGAGAECVDGV